MAGEFRTMRGRQGQRAHAAPCLEHVACFFEPASAVPDGGCCQKGSSAGLLNVAGATGDVRGKGGEDRGVLRCTPG